MDAYACQYFMSVTFFFSISFLNKYLFLCQLLMGYRDKNYFSLENNIHSYNTQLRCRLRSPTANFNSVQELIKEFSVDLKLYHRYNLRKLIHYPLPHYNDYNSTGKSTSNSFDQSTSETTSEGVSISISEDGK